jgi:pimeloyl-ACP methyl ester carboxylesterase
LAADLGALINHVTVQPVFIFGVSGGAVTAPALLADSPQLVRAAVLHEPPLFFLGTMASPTLRYSPDLAEVSQARVIPAVGAASVGQGNHFWPAVQPEIFAKSLASRLDSPGSAL